jgi:DNA-directed RNA polymerase specialized sigma24 family protein
MMCKKNTSPRSEAADYATARDFSHVFEKNAGHFYQLALLLTSDPAVAEQCLVEGLADSQGANRVFQEWAQSWARRAITLNAIRLVQPIAEIQPQGSGFSRNIHSAFDHRPEFAAILALPTFERFAFVMSFLEGISNKDCTLLLGCSPRDFVAARNRALQSISQTTDGIQAHELRNSGSLPWAPSRSNFVSSTT